MKIPQSFILAYDQVYPTLKRLEAFVEPRMQQIATKNNGVYSARIKESESILVKAEKGGYRNLFEEMDDLFACTITVPNSLMIKNILEEIQATFKVIEQRQRPLKPTEFAYNDLNLSLQVIPYSRNKKKAFWDLVFELQIKTLLQQAWSQAGHDIIYKAKRKTWGLERIASQLRALLEMADSILANLEDAANTLQENIKYTKFDKLNQITDIMAETWNEEDLPANLYRAAQVTESYLGLTKLNVSDLTALLKNEKYSGYIEARTLTPTQTVFIILFEEEFGDILPRLKKRANLITDEMLDLCPKLHRIPSNNRVNLYQQNLK